jgi:hypothetical protein
MPRAVTEVAVFIAWPGDNAAARDRARHVIAELDETFGKHHGVRVLAKDWKTHARPAGGNAQQNINNQVGAYDIFVGLLWTRLGMNAGRGRTGFVEEYEIARGQWKRRKSSLMLYVRESSPKNLAAIDAAQLQQVRDFVASVRKKYQALYWTYRTLPEFERELRRHLTDELHARLKLSTASPPASPAALPVTPAAQKPARKAPAVKPPALRPQEPKVPTAKKPRTPRLPVPAVARLLTDADRKRFARRGLNTCLSEFRVAAKAFNASHSHARITVEEEGPDAFTAVGEANGERLVSARVRLEAPSWGCSWALHYETASVRATYGGTLYYSPEAQIRTTDDNYTLAYEGNFYGVSAHGPSHSKEPLDVARAFWERFVRPLTARRR